jgi:hypothetical protein
LRLVFEQTLKRSLSGMDPANCGLAEPLMEMLRIDLKKLKPSFGGSKSRSLRKINQETSDPPQPMGENEEDADEDKCLSASEKDDDTSDKDADPDRDDEDSNLTGESEVENNDNGNEYKIKEEEPDVHQLLDDLDIPDFSLSVVFDATQPDEGDGDDEGDADFSERIKREEVYSKRYHPGKGEKIELKELASRLGVSSSGFRLSSSADALHKLLFGNHSIVLKKGPISSKDQNCDLYILTDGFILAYQNVSFFNPLGSRYEACHLWSDVDYIDIAQAGTLHIQTRSGDFYDLFAVSDGENVKTWLEAIGRVILQQLMHDPGESERTRVYGWQHTVIRQPGFTAAITGDMTLMGNPRNLNELDEYNQSAPLHYAMQQEAVKGEIVEALLRFGADPNFSDGDGRSAVYFAKRNGLSDIESILQEHGGKESKLAEVELQGELFGGVEQANRNTEKRRENHKAAEAAARAQAAQSQMSKNMAAMIERGEKIEEMDDKARQLNEQAKTYGDLAAQLKNNIKNKKWYQL